MQAIIKAPQVTAEPRIIPEPTFRCADCGKENSYDKSARRVHRGGCGFDWVCRDERTCEPTMEAIYGARRQA